MISRFFVRAVFLSFIISIVLVFNAKGQNGPDQKVSLKVINTRLGEVLHILELKTNFTFSYLNEELSLDENVTLNVENESLQQVLEILSNRFGLTFTRINKIITVKKKEAAGFRNIKRNCSRFGNFRNTSLC